MAGIYHPTRGGTRGGKDQFNWEDVRTDKERESYLGHSLMVPVGKWQEGKDLMWYTRDKKSSLSEKEIKKKQEMKAVKDLEARAMAAALGHKSFSTGTTSLTAKELQEVLSRGQTEHAEGERIQGVGHKNKSSSSKAGKSGIAFDGFNATTKKDYGEEYEEKSESSNKKKKKKEKKKKKKKRIQTSDEDEIDDEKYRYHHQNVGKYGREERNKDGSDRREHESIRNHHCYNDRNFRRDGKRHSSVRYRRRSRSDSPQKGGRTKRSRSHSVERHHNDRKRINRTGQSSRRRSPSPSQRHSKRDNSSRRRHRHNSDSSDGNVRR